MSLLLLLLVLLLLLLPLLLMVVALSDVVLLRSQRAGRLVHLCRQVKASLSGRVLHKVWR